MLFIGGVEIVFIVLIVIMLFGADKIPSFAKGAGKMMRQVKDASNQIKAEINQSSKNINLNESRINQEIKKANKGLSKISKKKKTD